MSSTRLTSFRRRRWNLGNRFLSGAVNGYQFSGITQLQSGAQLSAAAATITSTSRTARTVVYSVGTPDVTVAPVITCNPSLGLQKHQFVNGNCLAYPLQGTGIGNTRMPGLNGPMYWNSDLAAQKSFAITEHQNLELRLTAKDFLNHDLLSFNSGDPNLTLSSLIPLLRMPLSNLSTFGYATTNFGHRILELSAKYTF